MNKKGFEISQLMSIILITVAIVGLFVIVGGATGIFSTASASDMCKESLMLMDGSRDVNGWSWIGQHDLAKPIGSPNCPVEIVQIQHPQKNENEDAIKREIAEAFRRCFSKTGEGGLDPFNAKVWDKENYCILCSKITFDEKTQEDYPIIEGTYEFLKTGTMLLYDKTYWEYLTPADLKIQVAGPPREDFDRTENGIDTEKTYYVIWHYIKGSASIPFMGGEAGTAIQLRLLPLKDDSGWDIPRLDCKPDTTFQ